MSRRASLIAISVLALGVAACSGSAASTAPGEVPAASEAPPAGVSVCEPTTDAGTVTVTIEGRAFGPSTVTALVDDVISFENADSVPHTATLDDDACTTDTISGGSSAALTFSEPGTYPFHCNIHPTMTGVFEIS